MPDGFQTMRIPVEGLSCVSCVGRAEAAIRGVDGVREAEVNLATRSARVVADTATPAEIAAALDRAGYPAAREKFRLRIAGMHCGSCVGRVERALLAVPGVLEASVNLAAGNADVTLIEGTADVSALVAAVQGEGFGAAPTEDDTHAHPDSTDDGIARLRRQTLLAAALTLPVFVLEMGGHVVPAVHQWIAATIGMPTGPVIPTGLPMESFTPTSAGFCATAISPPTGPGFATG